MNKIRVLHIIHWPKSGIVNLVYNQIACSTNTNIEYKVGFFIKDTATTTKFKNLGVEVTNYEYNPLKLLITLFNIHKDIKKNKPNIIHTHSFLPGIFVRMLSVFFSNSKLISTIHNSYPYFEKKTLRDKIKANLEITSLNQKNSLVIVVSNYVKKFIIENTNIAPSLIQVVYPGIAIENNNISSQQNELGTKNVIIVGRLDKQKRHDRLLYIWKKVLNEIPDAQLLIVGDGSEKEMLKKITKALDIENNVKYYGFRTDISNLLRSSNVFVLTSDHEGLPLVIIESFLQKIPVIAFDIGPMKEIIDSKCGILVKAFDLDDFAQKIAFLLKTPKLSMNLGNNGFKKAVTNFNIERMVEIIEYIYFYTDPM